MNLLKFYNYIIIFLCFCCLTACQSTQNTSPVSQKPKGILEDAHSLFKQDKYNAALAKYSNYVYSPFPNKEKQASARYYMGVCQYFLEQYAEAIDSLTILLQSNPNFEYETEAAEIIRKCQLKINEKNSSLQKRDLDQINAILTLKQQVQDQPNNAQLHYQLGNQYWDSGDFKTAALHYEQAILQNPEYERSNVIRKRVYYNDNNVLVPRDPVANIQDQDETIRLSNIRQDVRKRSDFLGQIESIRVSGEAKNVSLRTVNGVQVEITLIDFFERIQDSQIVSLGSIRPGQIRTFSILLDQFSGSANDNLKVKTQVLYDH